MQRRKWDATTKALIVLESLKGKPVTEICTGHEISQSLYYQWREARLGRENVRLKKLVWELLLERKKSDALLG